MSDLIQRSAARAAKYKEENEGDPYWDQVVLAIDGNATPIELEVDPYDANVVLNMSMDDEGLTDSKGHAVSLVGNTSRSSAQSKFGGYSAYFDGSAGYIHLNQSEDFNFGTADFTIEAWVYYTGNTGDGTIISAWDATTWANSSFEIIAAGSQLYFQVTDGGAQANSITTSPLVVNTWNHVAMTKTSNILRAFVNGTILGSTPTVNYSIPSSPHGIRIGARAEGGAYQLSGYVDNVRITKGISRYNSSFTPRTVYSIADKKGHAINSVGTAEVSTTQKKFGTGSIKTNQNGSYLSLSSSPDWNLGSVDFTIESWIYHDGPKSITNYFTLVAQWDTTSSDNAWAVFLPNGSDGNIYFQYSTNGADTPVKFSPFGITTDVWHHIAVVRRSNSLVIFVDGSQVGNVHDMTGITFNSSLGNLHIGGLPNAGYTPDNGHVDDLRITKGVARYINPSYYTNYSNLVIATHCDGIDESQVTQELTGKSLGFIGTFVDTAQKRFGTSSIRFNGTSDYLTSGVGGMQSSIGTGPLTVSLWIKSDSSGSNNDVLLCDFRPYSTGSGHLICSIGGNIHRTAGIPSIASVPDGVPIITIGGIYAYGTTNVDEGTWHHIAVVRSSTNLYLFIDGNKEATITNAAVAMDMTVIESHVPVFGVNGYNRTQQNFGGWMDDILVVKEAIWSENFTPPTYNFSGIGDFTPPTRQNPDYGQPVDPYWDNVVLGLHMDGLDNGTVFHDEKGKTVTPNGNVKTVTSNKKFGNSSAYFDGAGDYLSLTSASLVDILGGVKTAFTIEAFCYLDSTASSYNMIINLSGNAITGAGAMMLMIHRPTQKISLFLSSNGSSWDMANDQQGTETVPLDEFCHIAITYDGIDRFRTWVNGVSDIDLTNSSTLYYSTSNTENRIGTQNYPGAPNPYKGYIDDLRITKGVARYTSNFTPPTRAFPRN